MSQDQQRKHYQPYVLHLSLPWSLTPFLFLEHKWCDEAEKEHRKMQTKQKPVEDKHNPVPTANKKNRKNHQLSCLPYQHEKLSTILLTMPTGQNLQLSYHANRKNHQLHVQWLPCTSQRTALGQISML